MLRGGNRFIIPAMEVEERLKVFPDDIRSIPLEEEFRCSVCCKHSSLEINGKEPLTDALDQCFVLRVGGVELACTLPDPLFERCVSLVEPRRKVPDFSIQ